MFDSADCAKRADGTRRATARKNRIVLIDYTCRHVDIPDVVGYHEVDGCSELRVRSFPDGLIATSPSTAAPYHPSWRSSPWRIPWSIGYSHAQSSPGLSPPQIPC